MAWDIARCVLKREVDRADEESADMQKMAKNTECSKMDK
jgi:hypothetical protein